MSKNDLDQQIKDARYEYEFKRFQALVCFVEEAFGCDPYDADQLDKLYAMGEDEIKSEEIGFLSKMVEKHGLEA